jgi:predicted DNA-binding transcriptional regulator YafY
MVVQAGNWVNRGERLTALEHLLYRNRDGLRAVELAKACGVDRRTIYRDLALLQKLGVPVTQEDGRFLVNRDYYLASVRMNVTETMALYLAARSFARYAERQNPFLVAALNKLCAALPEPVSSQMETVVDWMRGLPVDRNYVHVIETLIRGWVEFHTVEIWSRDQTAEDYGPHHLQVYFVEPALDGSLYVVGYDPDIQEIVACKTEWIKRAALLGETYSIPKRFDVRAYLDGMKSVHSPAQTTHIKVRLVFAPTVNAALRQRFWHPTQQIDVLSDQRTIISFMIADWQSLIPWLRSWGSQVEVLEPVALRHELATDALRVAKLYQVALR